MEYKIGIASHNRAGKQLTLDFLYSIGIPKERITMSVQCEKDFLEYKAAGVADRVGAFIYERAETAAGNRNTLLNHTAPGEKIVLIDDDIRYISRLNGKTLAKISTLAAFDHMIEKGFAMARKHKTVGFGIYPVHNAYFMSKGYTERNIVDAGLFAITNTDMRFDAELATKEDYEFCCRAIRKYGTFIRLNDYAVNSPAGHKGGCEEAWSDKAETARVARRLVGRYPDILTLNPKRPGEVKMAKGRNARRYCDL